MSNQKGNHSFGQKGPVSQPDPEKPAARNVTEEVQEEAPGLELMESSKAAMMSFLMYYYQSLRTGGYDIDTAKRMMADEIENLYDIFALNARITYKPDKLINPVRLLDEIIADAKSLGQDGKAIHSKLLDFKRLIK